MHVDLLHAAALAEDPALAGEGWYRSGDYANARESWSQESSADAHYNRGNALALLGEYEAALAAYDKALELQPGMPDAEHNREVVERLRQQQEQQQQGEQGESGDSDAESEQQEGQSPEESQGDEGEQGSESEQQQDAEQEGEPGEEESAEQDGEPGTDPAEAWSEEDAQAMEQWLRRIPDDPGGLLRRKFRSQHQSRGAPDDESEAW